MPVLNEEKVVQYVNQARTNPQSFAQYVKEAMNSFSSDGRSIRMRSGVNYITNEGKSAWSEAYQYLKSQSPRNAFKLSSSLSYVADLQAKYCQKINSLSHSDQNGRGPMARVQNYCQASYGAVGENIGQQFRDQGRNHQLELVQSLIIDDGVQDRGHRQNIFSNKFSHIGIGSSQGSRHIFGVMIFFSSDPPLKGSSNNNKPEEQQHNYNQEEDYNDRNEYGNQQNQGNRRNMGGFGDMGDMGGFGRNMGGFGNNMGGFGSNMTGFKGGSGSNMGEFGGNMGGFSNNMGGFGGNMDEFGGNMGEFGGNMGGFGGGGRIIKHGGYQDQFQNNDDGYNSNMNYGGNNSGKYPVSTQSSSSTKTVNGRSVTVLTQRITYSDGSVETKQTTKQGY